MDKKDMLAHVDHTLLSPTATWEDIQSTIDEAIEFGCASACIPPCYVERAVEYADGKIPICTVVGFPNGYNEPNVKALETQRAVTHGAKEIDMVINVSMVKSRQYDQIAAEIALVRVFANDRILKVIVESSDLSDEELERVCKIVEASGADYIKTSTGFSKNGGATLHAVETMVKSCPTTKVKASGGIGDWSDAQAFLDAGADRLGTSRLVKLARQEQGE